MPTPSLKELLNIYDVLSSKLDSPTGTITLQLGDAINKRTVTENAEMWQHVGFASRPANVLPNATDAPQCLAIARSDEDLVFATRDVRGQQLYRKLAEGETCLYASGPTGLGQALIYLKGDSSINLYTVSNDGKHTRQGMGICISPMEDSITIVNSQGIGLRIDSNGVMIIGKNKQAVLVGDNTRIGALQVGHLEAGDCNIESNLQVTGPATLGAVTTGALTAAHIAGASILASTTVDPQGGVLPGPITLT